MPCRGTDEIRSAADKLRQHYGSQRYFITCGSAGACAVDEDGEFLFADAHKPDPLVDSVGAGDAFAAATILGLTRGNSLDQILSDAVEFASRACTIQGATTSDRNHYALGDSERKRD